MTRPRAATARTGPHTALSVPPSPSQYPKNTRAATAPLRIAGAAPRPAGPAPARDRVAVLHLAAIPVLRYSGAHRPLVAGLLFTARYGSLLHIAGTRTCRPPPGSGALLSSTGALTASCAGQERGRSRPGSPVADGHPGPYARPGPGRSSCTKAVIGWLGIEDPHIDADIEIVLGADRRGVTGDGDPVDRGLPGPRLARILLGQPRPGRRSGGGPRTAADASSRDHHRFRTPYLREPTVWVDNCTGRPGRPPRSRTSVRPSRTARRSGPTLRRPADGEPPADPSTSATRPYRPHDRHPIGGWPP